MARQPEHLAEQLRTLGRYLAALRQAAGFCQADIARAVPCHRTTVSHAEAGSQLPDVYFKRRTLLRWGLGVTASSSLGGVPGGQLVDGCQFTPRAMSEATPSLGIDPIEHLQQMKKVLMDNDNIFGANSVILSVREQIGNLQQLRQGYQGASRKKILQVQAQFGDLCGWLYQDSGDYRAAAYWSGSRA